MRKEYDEQNQKTVTYKSLLKIILTRLGIKLAFMSILIQSLI